MTQPLPLKTELVAAPRVWDDPARQLVAAATAPWYRLVSDLLGVVFEETVAFYGERRYLPAMMPITVSSVSSPMGLGSDSLPVRIDLMGKPTYLADSLQFQLEFMLRQGYDGVYYLMPSFRGEDPDATHLNQFFHSEAEVVGGLDDVMGLVERYIGRLVRAIRETPLGERVAHVAGSLGHLDIADAFPRVTFADAVDRLGDDPLYVRELPGGAPALTRAAERRLIAEHGGIVWLTHPPHAAVPFYQAETHGLALAADLLAGPGEIAGCGERHATRARTAAALRSHAVLPSEYEWYLRMKEQFPLRTAGFGMGIERFLLWVLQHDDIRDIPAMPRLKHNESWI